MLDVKPAGVVNVALGLAEPSIDYVVTKIPRFAFEKFPQAGVAAFGRKPPFKSLRRSAETPLRIKKRG